MTTETVVSAAEPAALYRASRGRVAVIDVPELLFASVDGEGSPADLAFGQAIGALYPLAYGIRFALRSRGVDEKVYPLEALWWTADPGREFAAALVAGGFTPGDMRSWSWKAMIRLPLAADEPVLAQVRGDTRHRHPELATALERVRVRPWREGLCVQTLHVGPYAAELPTVELLHDYIEAHGYRAVGRHHEIYLGDPRRCAPQRLRTILRQPVAA